MKPFMFCLLALFLVDAWLLAAEPVKRLLLPASVEWICTKYETGVSCKTGADARAFILRGGPD